MEKWGRRDSIRSLKGRLSVDVDVSKEGFNHLRRRHGVEKRK